MDRLFVVDTTALPEYGSDGELIRYVCEHYIGRTLDYVVYTDNLSKEKSVVHKGREYKVIPITTVKKTEEYLKSVYNIGMPPIEVPKELRKYRTEYKVLQGKDIKK